MGVLLLSLMPIALGCDPAAWSGDAPCGAPRVTCTSPDGVASCVDLEADARNCGACGAACGPGDVCALGACAPEGSCDLLGLLECFGACVDPVDDVANCGGCGLACAFGETCLAGTCAEVGLRCLEADLTACGAACVDLTTDPRNCGACGNVCRSGCFGSLCY
ncbi:MAG TPA: hypothetical protein VGQ83_37120 [Polyangia bacterium]